MAHYFRNLWFFLPKKEDIIEILSRRIESARIPQDFKKNLLKSISLENKHMNDLMKKEVESPFKGMDYYLKLFKLMFSSYDSEEILIIFQKVDL